MDSKLNVSQLIAYEFTDPKRLELALTHRSFGADNNERLEFLGDALLNAIIGEALFRKFPAAREGELSRMRAGLVNGKTLTCIAREFSLGECLRMGAGENKTGGRQRESILADAVEAIIGAIYLDSDFETCRERVLDWFAARLSKVSLSASHKDAKTLLQEHLQGRGQPLPQYQLVATEGVEHQQLFTVACKVGLLREPLVATGSSRRRAEQAAAEKALQHLQQINLGNDSV